MIGDHSIFCTYGSLPIIAPGQSSWVLAWFVDHGLLGYPKLTSGSSELGLQPGPSSGSLSTQMGMPSGSGLHPGPMPLSWA